MEIFRGRPDRGNGKPKVKQPEMGRRQTGPEKGGKKPKKQKQPKTNGGIIEITDLN